mgnify:FL=1
MKRVTGFNYILLALGAFGGLMLEAIIAYGIEPFLYGRQLVEWSDLQHITHWIITCIMWGIISFLIMNFAKRKYDFDIWRKGKKVKTWQWILVVVLICGSLTMSYIEWNGSKVLLEFQKLGVLRFFFQYIYYIFEIVLVTLILVFGQIACEKWFKRVNIPYGGIVIAITWGMGHFLTKGFSTGILCMFLGLAYGSIYLLVNRDIRKTYLILWVMFVL